MVRILRISPYSYLKNLEGFKQTWKIIAFILLTIIIIIIIKATIYIYIYLVNANNYVFLRNFTENSVKI